GAEPGSGEPERAGGGEAGAAAAGARGRRGRGRSGPAVRHRGAGGSGASAASPRQPGRECGGGARRIPPARAPRAGRCRQRHRPLERQRHGSGRAARRRGAPLRALLLAQGERHRPRPRDRQADPRGARRSDHRRDPAAGRHDVRGRSAAREGAPGMKAVPLSQLVDAFVVLLPAAAQAAIAWQQRGTRRGSVADRATASWLPHPGIVMALSYALGAVAHNLLREPVGALPSAGRIAANVSIDVLIILGLAGYVHLARNQVHPEAPPARRWLAVNYGVAVALCLLAATFPDVIPLPTFEQQQRAYEAAFLAYYLTSTGRIVGFLVGPSGARPGVALFALGMALAGGGWLLLEIAGAPTLVAPLVAAIGLAFAVPFATDRLQRLVRVMLGVAGAVAAWRVARAALHALAALAATGQSLP